MMSLELPPPIAAYVAANARLDAEAMLQTFAADAVVRDDGEVLCGHAELGPWIEKSLIATKAIFIPDTLRRDGDQVIVEGPAHGAFKGSPIRFTFNFLLEGVSIKALEITA